MSWWFRVYIIHAGRNALFVTVVTSPSISPPALLPSLCTCISVCVCMQVWASAFVLIWLHPFFFYIWTTLFFSIHPSITVFFSPQSRWLIIIPVKWCLSRLLLISTYLLFQPANHFLPLLHHIICLSIITLPLFLCVVSRYNVKNMTLKEQTRGRSRVRAKPKSTSICWRGVACAFYHCSDACY